ncbi:branched-chain amino acid ABC transporter permease [Seleniivibrio woodruffii]|uniref:Amino acid/amide ABC transporter membrane protein 1 (HAAT family) n=1 Tax=Seleniivibrio woodruffii TaxID=1078050 RepID=A0A4R1K982_9BACT|nr:branched-chain amino acid ABC transporter permease [Seleniivibrio woodruffii]TCK60904.1 amino acid/amide ABC transporter membrane protein 1 (HAAT family) [Seleniivibrio woodruffii]TVZ36534.1 amino acid/amide ABC transporter membrane protein 1 (HAAT family) [Seleniivibrio woodruffii]
MDIFLQQVVNGLIIGSIYALVALGYTMVYGVMKLINFAHGDLVAFSAYVGLMFYTQLIGMGIIPQSMVVVMVFVLTAIVAAAVALLVERVAYRPLRNASRLSAVVSALGASMMIQNGIMLIWGPNITIFPSDILPAASWTVYGITITFVQATMIIITLILMVSLTLFINYTKMGTAIRASAINQDVAKLMGINVNLIIMIIFVVGAILGSVGGLFIGMYYRGISFNLGWIYGLNAFIAAILGGIGNIPGSMVGGYLLGLFTALIAGYVSSTWAEAFTFILLILILIVRPKGILGERVAEKV